MYLLAHWFDVYVGSIIQSAFRSRLGISPLGLSIWCLAAIFFLYEFFLRGLLGTLSEPLMTELHLSAATFGVLGAAYYIAYGCMQIPVGILADKISSRWLMTMATLLCAMATFWFARADNFMSVFCSRFLTGIGSSFAFICLLMITIHWFPKKYFAFFVGIAQFIGTLGPMLAAGPLMAFLLTSHQYWRVSMIPIAIFGVILSVLIFVVVRDNFSHKRTIHAKRMAGDNTHLFRLAANKQVWCIALFSGANYAPMAILGITWGTAFLQTRGLTAASSANILSIAWLGYAIFCPLLGVISDISQRRKPILIICSMIGLLATATITYLATTSVVIYAGLFFSVGFAAAGQNIGFAIISEQINPKDSAVTLGLNNTMISVFDALVTMAVGYLISLAASHAAIPLTPQGFIYGFTLLPLLYSVSLFIAIYGIKETYCQR